MLAYLGNHSHICVCVCTYKRPQLLKELLNKLQDQDTRGKFSFSILIVDNDINQSAELIVRSFFEKSPIDLAYYVEPVQNISLARNKAVKNSVGDFIAFIDDDEIPGRDWLRTLLEALEKHNADAVLGPVFPLFLSTPPKWVIKGKFCERPTYRTGYRIAWRMGRTGNLLFKRELYKKAGELFDPIFGSGGEDQDFTRRMLKMGFVFIWCNEAPAFEFIPPHRYAPIFMLKRALLRGKMAICYPVPKFFLMIKTLVAVPVYLLALPLLGIFGKHLFMQYLVKLTDHLGKILALLKLNIIKEKYIIE